MKFAQVLFVLAICLAFVGCVSRTETAPLVRVQTTPAAMAGCAPSARAVAPGYALAVAEPVGVASEVGPMEYARAIAGAPGNAIGCATETTGKIIVHVGGDVRDGINCWLDSLKPTPSVRYLYAQPAAVESPSCGCGRSCRIPSVPQQPAPIPLPADPVNPNDPPESIPAFRR